jgi:hypothetical protein
MVRESGPQPFIKATQAESARKVEPAGLAKSAHTEPTYAQGRCRVINPNAYCAPFNRRETPHQARNRRPAGWTAIWVTLPKTTVEGLQHVAITLAQGQQHSPWPRERRRYARTKSHLIGEALDDFFRKLGFEQFCLQKEQERSWKKSPSEF